MKFLITGGAGFIGSAVIRHLLNDTQNKVLNVDKLTYAGNLDSLLSVSKSQNYYFAQVDICNGKLIKKTIDEYKPDIIMHLAAESHVDRSIDGPKAFLETNIIGTYEMLAASTEYWKNLNNNKKDKFRFHHVSTDEVYGDLESSKGLFTENTCYSPSSPYSASKASSDHIVRAWHRTYGLPTIISNCSNNYGPYQFPEKLIPHVILNAIFAKKIPIYGNGMQIRDWLFVEDHAEALVKIATEGKIAETYNVGGHNEIKNIDVVNSICEILEELIPNKPNGINNFLDLITFVKDRPGHDQRYAIDASKIFKDLNWRPKETFDSGLRKTVSWYLDNNFWWERVLNGEYKLTRLGDSQ